MESEANTPAEGSRGRNSSKRNRGLLSCTECHRRKQKCNREQPCNDCLQRGVPQKCRYQMPITNQGQYFEKGHAKNARLRRIITGSEVILTPESVEALQSGGPINPLDSQPYQPADTDAEATRETALLHLSSIRPVLTEDFDLGSIPSFLGGWDPFSALPEIDGEPIPKKSLLFYFLQSLAPWLSNYDDSLTPTSPRVSWLPFALNHKVLFMATLLSAAVHRDRFQPLGDQRKLLWYKVETMRLANESLADPAEGASDPMILVALILLYFNVGGGNTDEYVIHLKGIHQMLKFRGGVERLGMRGMVKNWLDICYGPWDAGWEDGQFCR